jgi:serine protease Do
MAHCPAPLSHSCRQILRTNMKIQIAILSMALSAGLAGHARADIPLAVRTKTLTAAAPSLVVVQFTWASEVRKVELSAAGVVVDKDGLVLASLRAFSPQFPDDQLKDFKIIIPQKDADDEEIEAEFAGRDERYGFAYIRAKDKHAWTPLKFESAKLKVGQELFSVGMLPKGGGYEPYLAEAKVSALLRGAIPQVLTMGPLAASQSPVFDAEGKAVGLVLGMPDQSPYLSMGQSQVDDRLQLAPIVTPPHFFIPASDFLPSLADPPKAGEPPKLTFIGVREMKAVTKDVADYMGISNQPAIQLGDIIPGTPAAAAGIKRGAIITQLNGKPLERGSEPDDLPGIFSRTLMRMNVGDKVTLTILPGKDQPTKDVVVTLAERPMRANLAKRYYAEDLGFGVRELVFDDHYERKLTDDEKGVVITIVRPQSAAATARLGGDEMITQLNGQPVTALAEFEKDYEAFRKDHPKDAVVLVVKRDGREDTIRIEPPQ